MGHLTILRQSHGRFANNLSAAKPVAWDHGPLCESLSNADAIMSFLNESFLRNVCLEQLESRAGAVIVTLIATLELYLLVHRGNWRRRSPVRLIFRGPLNRCRRVREEEDPSIG